jgi:hypothetical protein
MFSVYLVLPAIALGLTGPLTEMKSRKISRGGGEARLALQADNLTVNCQHSCLQNVEASTSHNPIGLHGLLRG